MKKTKGKQIIFTLLFSLIIGSNVFAAAKQMNQTTRQLNLGNPSTLKLEILAEKQFVAYEPILLTVKLTNISKKEVLDVFLPIHIIGRCNVFATDGNKLPLDYRKSGMMVGGSTHPLNPGQIFSETFNLLDYFNMGEQGKYIVEYRYPLYQVKTNSQNKPFTVQSGVLTARLSIKVTSPQTGVEREALGIFKPAIEKQLRGEASGTIMQNYKRILKDYPTSRYAETALYYLAQYYEDAYQFDEAIQTYEEFIIRYPKSFYADIARNNIKEVQERAIREQGFLLELEKSKSEHSEKQENQK